MSPYRRFCSLRTFAATELAKGSPHAQLTARILVVEDNEALARIVSKMLDQSGYTVSAVASSGAEAILKATESRPDLVLMDIALQGPVDGADAAIHIHRELGLPVVYLTGNADEATLERAKKAQPPGYLLKPVSPQELHSAITMALYNAERRREEQQRLTPASSARHRSGTLDGVIRVPDRKEDGDAEVVQSADGLWQATVNYFERWNAYDQVIRTASANPNLGSLEEAARTLVALAENELRHSTEMFREVVARSGILPDEAPKEAHELLRASEQYFREMGMRDDLTRRFQQREVPQATVEQACSQVAFAQSRLRDAAIKFRDSAHLASRTAA